MTNLVDELINVGLTKKEAQVYTALMRFGSSRAGVLCKRLKINRTLVYAILDVLVAKGFVEKIIQNEKKIFMPNDPAVFVQKAKQQLGAAQLLVQNLHNIQIIKTQPVIRIFQGIEGIKQMTEMFLDFAKESKQEMLQMGQEPRLAKEYPQLIEDFISMRVLYKIPLKLLCNKSPLFDRFLNEKRTRNELREIKFVEEHELNVDCTTYICGDSMAVMSLPDEMHGYILKNKNITDLHRQMFYLLWNRL